MPKGDDSWDEAGSDPDAPLPSDLDDDDDCEDYALPDMACPECGARVTEDTQKCPRCGDWITPVSPTGGGWKKWWLAVAVMLMLLAMLRLVF